ncbi:alpha/beta hydrolase [Enteractinococcus coprophilus]|uniref:TAP-like protein n=1 Tax=Enteractinococcus coprophilus TaxID=1027633 RepID=A0A543AFS0_9MICC|nr:alpha/beta hydrolase [Enteractinococcus coprophilus]TQL71431.1 TAP-like protein [Enteractinococcus coprophilus]
MFKSSRTLAALGAIIALVATGCASDDAEPAVSIPDSVSDEMATFYDQTVAWDDCDGVDDFECGTVDVPLDYAHPEAETIQIHLTRAADNADRQPVLFNPGGPGASGISFVQDQVDLMLSDRLAENISAIGFDPRGVGASEPVVCLTGEEFDESRETSHDSSTSEGWEASIELTRELGENCLERSGDIVKFADTVSAAKDMDIIRAALELPKLDYFGISYGTKLGATYAEQFPEQVGKFVLDSVLAPSAQTFEVTKAQSAGFEQSLHEWAQWCADNSECNVGQPGDAESVLTAVKDFIAQVEEQPLQYPNGRIQPASDLFFGIVTPLYSREGWDMLAMAFEQGIENDFANSDYQPLFLFLADAYHGREPNGEYSNNMDAFNAINCLDYTATEKTLEQASVEAEELAENAPIFGPVMSYSTGCNGWPVEPAEPIGSIVAEGSDPIIVASLTSDPATPIHFSRQLAEELDNSIHITVEGEGHGAYSPDNDCIVEAIDNYILDDELPEDGLVCQ